MSITRGQSSESFLQAFFDTLSTTKRPTPVEYDIEELDQPLENPVSDKTAWWQEGTAKLLQELRKGQESGEPIPEEDLFS